MEILSSNVVHLLYENDVIYQINHENTRNLRADLHGQKLYWSRLNKFFLVRTKQKSAFFQ